MFDHHVTVTLESDQPLSHDEADRLLADLDEILLDDVTATHHPATVTMTVSVAAKTAPDAVLAVARKLYHTLHDWTPIEIGARQVWDVDQMNEPLARRSVNRKHHIRIAA